MYYITSSKYRDCQVVGSCIYTEKYNIFAYGDPLYMSHYLYSSGGGHFNLTTF